MNKIARIVAAGAILFTLSAVVCAAAKTPTDSGPSEPKLESAFPLGGQRGSKVELEIRGEAFDGVSGVWDDDAAVKAKLLKVELTDDHFMPFSKNPNKADKPHRVYRALIELEIPPKADLGVHSFRLLSSRGISNPISFRVTDEKAVTETGAPHDTVQNAQPVSFPVIIDGRVDRPAESDYYSFHAQKGQELSFEVLSAQNFDARLALFRSGGSWFDPQEPTRLLFEEERSSDLIPVQIDGHYRFSEAGEYFVRVSGLYGQGCPDCSYQVRIAPRTDDSSRFTPQRQRIVFNKSGGDEKKDSNARSDWQERSFARDIQGEWMEALASRTVAAKGDASAPVVLAGVGNNGGGSASDTDAAATPDDPAATRAQPELIQEREPNDASAQAQEVPIPAVIEGTIEHPGDVDSFKFSVKAGEKLAFEIETPSAQPPDFNPRVGVTDGQDKELFSNLYRRISLFNNNSDRVAYLQNVEPKSLYTFEQAGTYFLQIRDITSRYGGPQFRYRVLIRRQIPHVGEVTIAKGDHLNLIRGQARTLTLITSYEEGFTGGVSFSLEGLPRGVDVLPGGQLDTDRAPTEEDVNPEIVATKSQKSAIILTVDKDAPSTAITLVQLRCHPIMGGKLGPSFLVATVPVSVIDPAATKSPDQKK